MILLIVLLVAGAVLLGAWAASSSIESRKTVERSIQAIGQYGAASVREQEMLEPVGSRILAPVLGRLRQIAYRFTPPGYTANVKRKVVLAGSPAGFEIDRFLTLKILGLASTLVWFLLFWVVLGMNGLVGFLVVGLLGFFSFMAPDASLDRQIQTRQKRIEKGLADTLDLLVISVEAGLGFEQAIERTSAAVPGPLSDETRRMLQETRMGASRADALRALEERCQVEDVTTWVLAMLQADRFGISIARILKSQAEEMRVRWQQRAQEQAQRAPVKMLFPLGVCIFPAIFVVLLLPAGLKITETL